MRERDGESIDASSGNSSLASFVTTNHLVCLIK